MGYSAMCIRPELVSLTYVFMVMKINQMNMKRTNNQRSTIHTMCQLKKCLVFDIILVERVFGFTLITKRKIYTLKHHNFTYLILVSSKYLFFSFCRLKRRLINIEMKPEQEL